MELNTFPPSSTSVQWHIYLWMRFVSGSISFLPSLGSSGVRAPNCYKGRSLQWTLLLSIMPGTIHSPVYNNGCILEACIMHTVTKYNEYSCTVVVTSLNIFITLYYAVLNLYIHKYWKLEYSTSYSSSMLISKKIHTTNHQHNHSYNPSSITTQSLIIMVGWYWIYYHIALI